MGKSDKPDEVEDMASESEQTDASKDEIVDAEIVEEFPPEQGEDSVKSPDQDAADEAYSDDEAVSEISEAAPDDDAVEDTETSGEATDEDPASDSEGVTEEEASDTVSKADPADDTLPDDAATSTEDTTPPEPAPVVQERIVEKKGSVFTTLFGGLLAGGVGFLGAQYPDEWPFKSGAAGETGFETEARALLAEQGDALATLGARIDEVAGAIPEMPEIPEVDLSPVTASVDALGARIDEVQTSVTAVEERIGASLTEISDRVTALERAPVEATVSPEAIASYERELETMREAMAAQRETLNEAMAAQRSEIEQLAAEAVAAEQSANEQAALAAARGAFAELTAALENGSDFAAPLAVVAQAAGAEAPDALSTVAGDGVATQQALIEAFPSAARAALGAVRSETANEGGLGGFLMGQLGARSVTPRDGDDPDAVLSRAEAAVRGGDLAGALSEIETLPDAARAALGGWPAMAQTRLDALSAAAALGQTLNQE